MRRDNLASALVYAATGSMVRGTMVQGEWVYLDGFDRSGKHLIGRMLEISRELEGILLDPGDKVGSGSYVSCSYLIDYEQYRKPAIIIRNISQVPGR